MFIIAVDIIKKLDPKKGNGNNETVHNQQVAAQREREGGGGPQEKGTEPEGTEQNS